jgi:hypothetical protein
VGSLIGAALVLALAYWWFRKLGVDSLAQAAGEPPIAEPEVALPVEE